MKLHKVLIFGDRSWAMWEPIEDLIDSLVLKHGTKNLLVISGGAPGADIMAADAARRANVHVAEVRALWDTRSQGAGPQRNEVMAALEPDEAYGFHNEITKSKGTKDMMNRCKKAGIPVEIRTSE